MNVTANRPLAARSKWIRTAVLGAAFGAIPVWSANAQTLLLPTVSSSPAILLDAEAEASDKIALLHELALIESNVHLGMLFAHDHLADPTDSHASDPHRAIWPALKDSLLALGVTDFGPLLQQFAETADEKAVATVGAQILAEVAKARSKLAPTEAEISASVLELTREAAAKLNADGPTDLAAYQDAWAILSVARTEADLLLRAKDPVLAKSAVKIVLALDDVILFMPDPAAAGPVSFDKALVDGAADQIDTLLDGGA
jgi:hypothetical protein